MIGMSLAEHLEHSNRPQWRLKGYNKMRRLMDADSAAQS